ncbi:ribonuclease P protein component [Pseudoroseicyclus sp. CXY001]|uniref:ribonuclease P protein component n=1 Tax=Pseudoroseicyclus sp. CXY001 TaxID=3242492 RepID=UPI00358DD808
MILAAGGAPATLRSRAEFLRTARGGRAFSRGFVLQGRPRDAEVSEPAPDEDDGQIRVGYTCSKKVGNAVARNRAKRRLRALAREVIPAHGRPGWDYVLIGKAGSTASRDFSLLKDDLARALAELHEAAA